MFLTKVPVDSSPRRAALPTAPAALREATRLRLALPSTFCRCSSNQSCRAITFAARISARDTAAPSAYRQRPARLHRRPSGNAGSDAPIRRTSRRAGSVVTRSSPRRLTGRLLLLERFLHPSTTWARNSSTFCSCNFSAASGDPAASVSNCSRSSGQARVGARRASRGFAGDLATGRPAGRSGSDRRQQTAGLMTDQQKHRVTGRFLQAFSKALAAFGFIASAGSGGSPCAHQLRRLGNETDQIADLIDPDGLVDFTRARGRSDPDGSVRQAAGRPCIRRRRGPRPAAGRAAAPSAAPPAAVCRCRRDHAAGRHAHAGRARQLPPKIDLPGSTSVIEAHQQLRD